MPVALITGVAGQDGSYLAELLLGDPSKAKKLLGWKPTVTFEGLVEMMTKADLELAASEAGSKG